MILVATITFPKKFPQTFPKRLKKESIKNIHRMKEHAGAAGLVDWVAMIIFPKLSPKYSQKYSQKLQKTKEQAGAAGLVDWVEI